MKQTIILTCACALVGGCQILSSKPTLDKEKLRQGKEKMVKVLALDYEGVDRVVFKKIKRFDATGSWDFFVTVNDNDEVRFTMMNWEKLEFYVAFPGDFSLVPRADKSEEPDISHIDIDYGDDIIQ